MFDQRVLIMDVRILSSKSRVLAKLKLGRSQRVESYPLAIGIHIVLWRSYQADSRDDTEYCRVNVLTIIVYAACTNHGDTDLARSGTETEKGAAEGGLKVDRKLCGVVHVNLRVF